SPASRSSMKLIPLTTRPSLTSRHAMTRLASTFDALVVRSSANPLAAQRGEVGNHLQAHGAGFFRMELHAKNIFPLHRRGKRQAIITRRCRIAMGLFRRQVVGVGEVNERRRADSSKQAAGRGNLKPVPSHVRDLESSRERGWEAEDGASEDV